MARNNPYFSRPVGSNEPFSFRAKRRTIECKEVYIGNHKPNDHFVPGIADPGKQFVKAEDLYDNRPRKR